VPKDTRWDRHLSVAADGDGLIGDAGNRAPGPRRRDPPPARFPSPPAPRRHCPGPQPPAVTAPRTGRNRPLQHPSAAFTCS
jgi:hypothetical protein